MPFLNSPTTATVTPVRRSFSRLALSRDDRSVRPLRSAMVMTVASELLLLLPSAPLRTGPPVGWLMLGVGPAGTRRGGGVGGGAVQPGLRAPAGSPEPGPGWRHR